MLTIEMLSGENFEYRNYKAPSFVLDEGAFESEVQKSVYHFTYIRLDRRIETEYKKEGADFDEDKIDTLEQLRDMVKEKADCDGLPEAGDYVSKMFVLALNICSGITVGVAGFDGMYADTIQYGNQYIGVEEWSDSRKQLFSSIKETARTILSKKFNLKELDKGRNIYKPFAPELSSKAVDMYINTVFGYYNTTSEGKKDNKVYGLARRSAKKEKAFVLLMKAMFCKYGCEVKTGKVKEVDVLC